MRIMPILPLAFYLAAVPAPAQEAAGAGADLPAKIVRREQAVAEDLRSFHPLVETYIQVFARRHGHLELWHDRYFLSQAKFSGQLGVIRFQPHGLRIWRDLDESSDALAPNSVQFDPGGFVGTAYPESSTFDLKHYSFQFVKREFLGEVRCLVFDIRPITLRKYGFFEGRIWVEDEDLTIVRFNGKYHESSFMPGYFHFDSWRTNVGPHLWVPAVIYSEELNQPCCGFWKLNWTKLRFKAQTRFWGYNAHPAGAEQELAKIVVDSSPVQDASDAQSDRSPVEQLRAWQREAEQNITDKLEQVGLLAPVGEIEKTLRTVATNLEVTNSFSFEPDLEFRILLTSRLESTAVGHTIFLSRGLVDVLPNEATLAAVLARNMALIRLGYASDTGFAFADRARFPSKGTFRKMYFAHSERQWQEAGKLAQQWMANSPYKDNLESVAQFVAQLRSDAFRVFYLLQPNIGSSVADTFGVSGLSWRTSRKTIPAQFAALPLGSRVVLNPWTDTLAFLQVKPADALPGDSRAFAVTPFMPRLRRTLPNDASAVSLPGDARN